MLKLRKIFSVLLAMLISTTLIQVPAFGSLTQQPVSRAVEVLEVQPGTSYDLSSSTLTGILGGTVNLTQMSMPEFISKVDEINGKYDIVYIGNNTSGGSYTALGTAAKYLPVCQTPTLNGSGKNSKEYYSENDITNRRAATLLDFIKSNQLTIFDKSIFNLGSAFKLYNNFSTFVNNTTYPNFITVNTSSHKSSNLATAFSAYTTSAHRPSFTLTSQPTQYDGSSYSTVNYLGYAFNISTLNNANMKVELYIDNNGDGIFRNSEIVSEKDYNSSSVSGSINYSLPSSFIGLQPWKIEVTDKSTGAKSYTVGTTAFKATVSGGGLKVRVLQLEPSGNTLSIYSLHNVKNPDTNKYVNLLAQDQVYNIDVTEMSVANFNAAYANLQTGQTPPSEPAIVNGVSKTVPTALNGNYDMMILGFADSFGGNDLNANAIQALQSFINTNQSVMFTHDTVQYHLPIDAASFPGTYNLTNSFRQLVGQQRYYHSNEMLDPTNRTYDPMPDTTDTPQKYSYGYTNRLLDRFKTGSRVGLDTTTQAYKVNDNYVTEFPFVLGNIPVATTHYQWYQLDLEDPNVVPVYTLYDSSIYNNQGDGRNDYYTYTKGNITYSGTGHSVPNGFPEEEMFVNTMLKASKGANHAPTLVVNGISNGMNISNTLPNINFDFTATDIDLNDQYLNADISLSTSTDGTNFGAYQNVQHFSAADSNSRVTSGVAQSVSVPTVNSSIKAYKVKVVAYDSDNAQASQEIALNCVNDPSIAVTSSHSPSCLVGDTLNIPVSVTAQKTLVSETFTNISLQGVLTNPDNSSTNVYNPTYPDLTFNPDPSWTSIPNSYSITLGTQGNPSSAGTYTISNQLKYTVNNNVVQPNPTTSSITVYSGTIGVNVSDQYGQPITGVPLKLAKATDGSVVATGTTTSTGYYSFTGLSSGDYTVTADNNAVGRTIDVNSSPVSLSVSNHTQEIKFTMSGDLLTNPSITASDGTLQMTALKNAPLQTILGGNLTRPATYLNFILDNSLSGSTANIAISKVSCNHQDIGYTSDSTNPGKITPSQATSFPSGTYIINATVTMSDGTMQPGQSFTLTLDPKTSAQDANTKSEETIGSSPPSVTVNVASMLTNPSLTTRSGSSQMNTLINAPLQTNIGFTLTGQATFLKVDLTNSYSGSTTNVVISKVFCENQGKVQDLGFTADSDPGKLIPSTSTPFPSGNYTIYATVTIGGVTMKEGDSYKVSLTQQTSAQDANTGKEVLISTVPPPLTVYVLASPKYH